MISPVEPEEVERRCDEWVIDVASAARQRALRHLITVVTMWP